MAVTNDTKMPNGTGCPFDARPIVGKRQYVGVPSDSEEEAEEEEAEGTAE